MQDFIGSEVSARNDLSYHVGNQLDMNGFSRRITTNKKGTFALDMPRIVDLFWTHAGSRTKKKEDQKNQLTESH